MKRVHRSLLFAFFTATLFGQTQVDLKTQSKSIDFSGANATKPLKSGTFLPPVCSVGEMFYKTDAPAGANLYACTSLNTWTLEAGGGGGGGASMAVQLGDFAITRTSASTLTIGANCSASTPCNVRFGNLVYSVITSATATTAGGTGAAYFYVSPQGTLTVGHNVTVTCSATCAAQSGITSFPPGSVPLYRWSATNGAWDPTGGSDLRAFTSTKVVQPGAGITSTEISGITILGADATLIGMRAPVPATSTSACVSGSYAVSSSFYYLCVSSGSWRRVAVTSW
jgi:hypothetical protein